MKRGSWEAWTLRGPHQLRLLLREWWERNPAQGAPRGRSVEPKGFKRRSGLSQFTGKLPLSTIGTGTGPQRSEAGTAQPAKEKEMCWCMSRFGNKPGAIPASVIRAALRASAEAAQKSSRQLVPQKYWVKEPQKQCHVSMGGTGVRDTKQRSSAEGTPQGAQA